MKTAILQVADTGPLDSLVEMLGAVGYRCLLCSHSLRDELRKLGCDTVQGHEDLVRSGSYEPSAFSLGEATVADMENCDLYVDVKGHRAYKFVVGRWPQLRWRVLWYRINGGKPEHVINDRGDHGDEVNPPCPVLTPDMWYEPGDRFYPCWPPFVRAGDYADARGIARSQRYTRPLCLVHNLQGWGWGAMIEPAQRLGIALHGNGCPDGVLKHQELVVRLRESIAMVHIKSVDAPGYAIYEAMAAGCPVICSRRLIWRSRMEALLEEGKTCLCFDRPTHDPLSPEDVEAISREIEGHLKWLGKTQNNLQIGEAGRERLKWIMWSKDRPGDVESLAAFMQRNFS